MAQPANVSLHAPVIFSHQGHSIPGHVARKSTRTAIVVTADGSEYQVPWTALSPWEGGQRRRVNTRSATLKARFHPGQRVSFKHRSKTQHATVTTLGPKRACVACDNGKEVRVPYEILDGGEDENNASATRLKDVSSEAERLMEHHGLSNWSFQFDDAYVRAGCCNHGTKTISLSHLFVLRAPEHEVQDTVLHEIAHALVGSNHGHDQVWRAAALSIGCSGRRCHRVRFAPPRYVVSCLQCQWKRKAQKRNRYAVCRACRNPVFYQPFTEKAWKETAGSK